MNHLIHLLTGLLASLFLSLGYDHIAAKLMGLNDADMAPFCNRAAGPTVFPCHWA